MCKLYKTETLVTIGYMAYVWEVSKLTCIVVYVYISSLTQFAYFLSLFELVKVGKKCLRNWLNYVPDLIQDI